MSHSGGALLQKKINISLQKLKRNVSLIIMSSNKLLLPKAHFRITLYPFNVIT